MEPVNNKGDSAPHTRLSPKKPENSGHNEEQKTAQTQTVNKTEYLKDSKYTYATLMETSGEESESWYYFIRYQGNEEALKHLSDQIESVDWYILDDLSTFDIEIGYLVSERTAKEMTKIDMNHTSFHRKFDGKLKKIDLGFKPRHSTEKKMSKAFDILSYGQIEDYVTDEDIDPEDMVSGSESDSESDSKSNYSSHSRSRSRSPAKKASKLPGALQKKKDHSVQDIPRQAAARRYNNKKKHKYSRSEK